MKKFRKLIGLLLAVLLLAGTLPAEVFAAADDYPNTYKNTGDSRMDIIGVAATQIGYEEDSEGASKYGAWYDLADRFDIQPWCAMFVAWCADQAGISTSVIPKTASVQTLYNYMQQNGCLRDTSYIPQAGDLVFYDWPNDETHFDHVGLVEYSDSNGIHTIEGNYSDRVGRHVRTVGSGIIGYGTPSYGSSAAAYDIQNPGTYPAYAGLLQTGSGGAAVRFLQDALNVLDGAGLTVTGTFDAATDAAARAFQSANGLTADGQIGPLSWAKLTELLQAKYGYVNIGTDFYAYLIHAGTWTQFENAGGTVQPAAGNDSTDPRQVWYFSHQTDGSYEIVNQYDDTVLGGSGTAVQSGAAGKWFLSYEGSGVVLRLADTETVLARSGSEAVLQTRDNSAAQIFSVYHVDADAGVVYEKPAKPAASVLTVRAPFDAAEQTALSWTASPLVNRYDERTYTLQIFRGAAAEGTPFLVRTGLTETSLSLALPGGTYTAVLSAVNDRYPDYAAAGAAVTFSVPKTGYNVIYDANGGSGAPAAQSKQPGDSLTLSAETPVREGYAFLGWAADASAAAAEYQPGGVYTADADTTLYAVWHYAAPAAPQLTGLRVDNGVRLTWTNAADYEGILVRRAAAPDGDYELLAALGGSAEAYWDKTAEPGTTYYYEIFGTAPYAGKTYMSPASNVLSGSVPAAPAVTAAAVGADSVLLRWSAVEGAAGYYVFRQNPGTGGYTYLKNTASLRYTDTGLTAGSRSNYLVCAWRRTAGGRENGYYGAASAVPLAAPVLNAVYSNAGIQVNWSAVEGTATYNVYRAESETGTYSYMASVSGTGWRDHTAQGGTTYYYKVRAYKRLDGKIWYGQPSNLLSGRTAAAPALKAAPTESGGVLLRWSAVSGAAAYDVFRENPAGGYTYLKTTTALSYTDTGLTAGTVGRYKVCASWKNGTVRENGYYGSAAAVALAAPALTVSGVSLTWTASDGATAYNVYRADSETGTYTYLASVYGTAWTDQTAASGTTCYYEVRAYKRQDGKIWYSQPSAALAGRANP